MFSPSQNTSGGPAMATRSRRRQRNPSADNSLTQQPKAKRQRVPLSESTYTNPEVQNTQPEMLEVKHDKTARLPSKPDGLENATPATRTLRREVAVRSKKPKQGERTSKSDGSVELVSWSRACTAEPKRCHVPCCADFERPYRQKPTRIPSANYKLCRIESVQILPVST